MDAGTKLEWPPKADRERLNRYLEGWRLYKGDHERVFVKGSGGTRKFRYDDCREYVCENLCKRLTDILTQRLVGESPQIKGPEDEKTVQDWIDAFLAEADFEAQMVMAALGASYRGDAAFKIWYNGKTQSIEVGTVLPSNLFVEVDPLDANEVTAINIIQHLSDGDKHYLWRERHEEREGTTWIVNELFEVAYNEHTGVFYVDWTLDKRDLSTLPALAGLEEEVNTGVNDWLVVHVRNKECEESGIWGMSDYEGLVALQGEINNRLTQRAEVLDKYVDPIMYGPDIREQDPDTGKLSDVDLKTLKYVFQTPGETAAPVGMLVWDSQQVAVDQSLRELKQAFASVAGIDISLIVPPEAGGPVSGRALKLSQTSTASTVREKQRTLGPALVRVLSVATKLANSPGVVLKEGKPRPLEVEEITVTFSDGLPTDSMEEIEEQARRIESGTQDALSAIIVLDDCTEEDAQQKLDRIQEAAQQGAPPPAAGGFGFQSPLATAQREQAIQGGTE